MIKRFFKSICIKVKKSINIKLCLWIAVSLIISIAVGILSIFILKPIHFVNVEHVDYDRDRYDTEEQILQFINKLYSQSDNYDKYIKENIKRFHGNIYICDKDGKVKYKNINDGYGMIENINLDEFRNEIQNSINDDIFQVIYPITIENNIFYFIMIKKLDGISIYTYEITYAISIIISAILFIILIYLGIRKKVKYIEYIAVGINEISKGNLNYKINKIGEDELSKVAEQINHMEKSLLSIIERERNSEKNQRELITNISHDLKTPLTVILGYLDIIRTKAYKNEEEYNEYIDTVYKKAKVLEKMIFDLFELVKLGDGEDILNKSNVNINKVLRQVVMDYLPMAEEKNLSIDYIDSESTIILNVDLNKICRVFNNLMDNAIKYTVDNGNIKVHLKEDEAGALIIFTNTCKNINKQNIDNIFDRFYRGDKARSSKVEGSGVGLSIVKKIIEIHNSNIWAELKGDEILFNIRLRG